jgi:hypothetical protein
VRVCGGGGGRGAGCGGGGEDSYLDGHDLLRDDRQDLQIDAIELIEARPRTGRRQALEELAKSLCVCVCVCETSSTCDTRVHWSMHTRVLIHLWLTL